MKYITLGKVPVPAIGLGTYKLTGPTAVEVIIAAIGMGYRHIDTAQLYDNEKEVGLAIKNCGVPRDQLFLTTKVWPSNLTEEKFIPSVRESLRKLGTPYVDLLLIHWPHHEMPVEEYTGRLTEAQHLGLAREIGVSNFNIAQLKAAISTGARIVTNQVEFHPWINQTKLYDWMMEHQIPLTAYCPLGQGKLLANKKLIEVAAKYLRSPAQIILRWDMQRENILPIPRSGNPIRLKENISVFDFELAPEEMEMINAWRLENIRVVGAQAGAVWDS